MMLDNFQVFGQKCFAKFLKSSDEVLEALGSSPASDLEAFLRLFQASVKDLFVLEKHAKSRFVRKVHKMVLCLNSLVVEHFAALKSRRQAESTKSQNMFTRFKMLIKKLDSSVANVLRDRRLGSVEMLLNCLDGGHEALRSISKNDLLQMLRQCVQGQFEFTVERLYAKSRRKSLRYSTSFNLKRSNLSSQPAPNYNFLEHDTLDYSRSAINHNISFFADSEGVLLRDTTFFDASFELVRNFLDLNKLLLSHFIPSLI